MQVDLKSSNLISFFIATLLCGCAAAPKYSEPTNNRVRMRATLAATPVNSSATVFRFEDDECDESTKKLIAGLSQSLLMDQFKNSQLQSLGMPNPPSPQNSYSEVYIPANTIFRGKFSVVLHFGNNVRSCDVNFGFESDARSDYEVVVSVANGRQFLNNNTDACFVTASKLTLASEKVLSSPIKLLERDKICRKGIKK